MNKIRKFSAALFALVLVFVFSSTGLANSIHTIDLDVTLHKDGSATFVDTRSFKIDKGTEHYLSFANLGESELKSFKVYENGQLLQDIGTWDVNASIEEKAGKYGINKTADGFELCFGVGSLGEKKFTIEYTFSNVVRGLTDGSQAIYWQMINPGMDPTEKIRINVKNDFDHDFLKDKTRIWGFGYKGSTELTDKMIKMDSGASFSQSEYMVLLTIFSDAPFTTSSSYDVSSDDLINTAMEGASLNGQTYDDFKNNKNDGTIEGYDGPHYEDYRFNSKSFILNGILGILGKFVMGLAPFIAFIYFLRKKAGPSASSLAKNYKDVDYYRDLPYKGTFYDVNALVNFSSKNVISALILKWLSEGRLSEDKEIKGIFKKREVLTLRIDPSYRSGSLTGEDETESDLWDMVVAAAKDDGILTQKEFSSYVSKHISKFNEWSSHINTSSKEKMVESGHMEKYQSSFLFIKFDKYKESIKGETLKGNIFGFKKYLLDFSLLNEREMNHVAIWDDFMIWAAYMGIADKVYEQFKIVDPEFENTVYYSPTTIYGVNNFAVAAVAAQSSANSSSSFSGGGGSSFSGGGGGASGGSFGGGSR